MTNFSFGTPASSGASSGGVFGTAGNAFGSNQNSSNTGSGGGLFGNVGASSTTTSGSASPSLFGTSSAGGQGPSAFGKPSGTATTGGNTGFSFGGQSQPGSGDQSPALFGGSQTPNKTMEPTSSGQAASSGPFGGAGQSGASLFGNKAATPGPAAGSLFGNTSTTPAGPPPGNKPSSLFGGGFNAAPASSTPSSTAAATPTTSQPASGGLFGPGAATAGKPLFGAAQPAESTTPTTAAESSVTKPLFGAATTPATSGAQTSQTSFLFPMPSAGGDAAAKPIFSSLGAPASTTSAAAISATPATQPSLLPSTSTTVPSSTEAAAPAGGLFRGLAAQSTPATTPGTAATTAAAPATTSAAQPAGPAGGAFSKPTASAPSTQPAATTATAAPTTAAAATTAGATAGAPTTAGLGASTAGPAPPAQSRLKNKTMDEIITRWATDLTKYQKDFREQAEKVAEWDRMLVENGTKVQKLYGSTVDAERATQEVERQLASVEGQQEELSSWLDRYEREVDEMVSKQVGHGESLQGPDQERERTYKLAEKLSERLDEMGKDLTSMIEEVNGASATLSKTNRTDEPISQIVRVLNSHLSQLQVIDQGTSELQAKVSAAQKAGQSISSRLGYGYGNTGMGGGNAADDFYRSYMGRR